MEALKRAAGFIGEPPDDIKFELNTNFDLTTMQPEETRIVLEAWANFSALTTSEMREAMRRSGFAKLPDDQYLAEVKADKALKDLLGVGEGTQEESDNRSTVTSE